MAAYCGVGFFLGYAATVTFYTMKPPNISFFYSGDIDICIMNDTAYGGCSLQITIEPLNGIALVLFFVQSFGLFHEAVELIMQDI